MKFSRSHPAFWAMQLPVLTQKERDIETGLDFFGARYYTSVKGRFVSPDPLLSSGRSWDPQSWNRNSYTLKVENGGKP